MKIFLLSFLLACCQAVVSQNSCSFQNQNCNVNWTFQQNGDVRFNLTCPGFPRNGDYWIAFGYSQTNLVLISTVSGQAQLTTANLVNNQPVKTVGSNILQSQSTFLVNDNLEASFSIPLSALMLSSNNGQGCMTWRFYLTPTQTGIPYSGAPAVQQVCRIQQLCNVDGNQRQYQPSAGGPLYRTAYQGQDTLFDRTNSGYFNDPVLTASYTGSPTGYAGATIAPLGLQPSSVNLRNIYYPYLQPVVNPNSPEYRQAVQQDAAAEMAYQDPNCTGGSDPYWCASYVRTYLAGQSNNFDINRGSQQPSQAACTSLQNSLQNAYHRCCQTVRTAGC